MSNIFGKQMYLFSGLVALGYSLYAGVMYHSLSGKNLLDIDTANKMINQQKLLIIDVRTESEYKAGHYKKAINIPFNSINISNQKLKEIDVNSTIIVHCRTGNRARMAMERLNCLGFKNVFYIRENYPSLK